MVTRAIKYAAELHGKGETIQPVKQYLRFNDHSNRIIAMPAFVGGSYQIAGIKRYQAFRQISSMEYWEQIQL